MSGGNTVYLLEQLQKTGAFEIIVNQVKDGKTYIGTSAGSIVAGPKIPLYLESSSDIQLDDCAGFGFINSIVVPHWGSKFFEKLYNERMKLAYQDNEPPFILLNDRQYIVVKDSFLNIKIVDTTA